MIIGFSHVAVNVSAPLIAAEALVHLGFKIAAVELGRVTTVEEIPFLHNPERPRDLVLCTRNQSPAVEFISGPDGMSPWQINLPSTADSWGHEFSGVIFGHSGSCLLCENTPSPSTVINGLYRLGFSVHNSNGNGLFLKSALRWLCLEIEFGKKRKDNLNWANKTFIDEAGFRLIALLSSQVSQDIEILATEGWETSNTFETVIGSRRLRLALARIAGIPVIELIEPIIEQ
jgi:hypothetical protein